ncbi:MAG: hypothetical protein ACRBDL_03060 [Alphaproteobacteria bacterium]
MPDDFETWKKQQQAEMDAFKLQQQVEMDALRQNTEIEDNNVPSEISNVVEDDLTVPDSDVQMGMVNMIAPIENPSELLDRAGTILNKPPQDIPDNELRDHVHMVAEAAGFEVDEFTLDDIVMSLKDSEETPMYLQGGNAKADIQTGGPEGWDEPDVPIHEETVEVAVTPQTTTIITKTTEEYVIENGKIRGEPQEDHNARVEGVADRAAELMGGEWDREQVIEALQSNSLDKETRIQLEAAVSQGMQENGVSTMKYESQFFNMGEIKDQLINNRMTGDFKRELQHYEPSASLNEGLDGFELAGGDGSILQGDTMAVQEETLSGNENNPSSLKM